MRRERKSKGVGRRGELEEETETNRQKRKGTRTDKGREGEGGKEN